MTGDGQSYNWGKCPWGTRVLSEEKTCPSLHINFWKDYCEWKIPIKVLLQYKLLLWHLMWLNEPGWDNVKVVEAFVGEEDMICHPFPHSKIKKSDNNSSNSWNWWVSAVEKHTQGILTCGCGPLQCMAVTSLNLLPFLFV